MKHFLLLLLCFSLVAPLTVSAVCIITGSENCDTYYPGPPKPTWCRNGSGQEIACCSNITDGFLSEDNCPYNGVTPTPGPGCGHNNQMCCPGAVCLDTGDQRFNFDQFGCWCLNQAQIDARNLQLENQKDKVVIWCGSDPLNPGIRTAIGCIPTSPRGLVNLIVSWTAGLGGGVALLSLVYAGFVMITAGGDVKKVNSSKTIITSAIIGLVIIVLAVVILNFIGIRLFGLNNFGFGV